MIHHNIRSHPNGPNTRFDPKKTESSKYQRDNAHHRGLSNIVGSYSQPVYDVHSSRKIDETVETNIVFRIRKHKKGDPSYEIVRAYGQKGI